jgi:hypothetical protein
MNKQNEQIERKENIIQSDQPALKSGGAFATP